MKDLLKRQSFWAWLTTLSIAVTLALPGGRALLNSVYDSARSLRWNWAVGAFVCVLVQLALQCFRFAVLFPVSRAKDGLFLGGIYAKGQVLNQFVMGRAGDAYKVMQIAQAPATRSLGYLGVVGVLFAERILELPAALVVIAAVLLTRRDLLARGAYGIQELVQPKWLALAVVIALLGLFIASRSQLQKFRQQLRQGLNALTSWPRALSVLGSTWAIMFLEAGSFMALSRGIALEGFGFSDGIIAVVALNLGIALPVTAGALGQFEAGVAGGMLLAGVPLTQGLAVGALHHLLILGGWLIFAKTAPKSA